MELFINQGKDSTVEPGYLAEMGSKSNATPSPSPEPETFEVILNTDDGITFTPNKTFAETVAAIQNGKAIVLKLRYDDSGTIFEQYMTSFYDWVEPETINAIYIPLSINSHSLSGYMWDSNGIGASSFVAVVTVNP